MARASKPSTAATPAKRRTTAQPRKRSTAARVVERDPGKAPHFHRWVGRQPGVAHRFDAQKRAQVVEAIAANGRMDLAAALAGVDVKTITAWRKKGQQQLRELERHEAQQDRLATTDSSHVRQPYAGPLAAAEFAIECARAAAWWEARRQDRLQQVADDPKDPRNVTTAMWLLARHDRLTGKVKGELHEHHHHEPPSAIAKLGEIVARRKALRGGGE
ncbi:MAG: hypothetical protein ACRCZP_06005 [Phycicoccus sp.]